jgi:hypothetical protein
MALIIFTLSGLLDPATPGRAGALMRIAVSGGLGAAAYLGICLALRVEALAFFGRALKRRN